MTIEKLNSTKRETKKADGADYVFVVESAKGANIRNVDNDTVAIDGDLSGYVIKATSSGVVITSKTDKQFKVSISLQKANEKKGIDAGQLKLTFADGSLDLTRDGKNIVLEDGTVVSKKAKDAAAADFSGKLNAEEGFDDVTAETPTDAPTDAPTDTPSEAPGSTILLTAGQDVLTGTANNDTFIARVLDNGNTFQSGDIIDGGAGTDTLDITLGSSSNFAILAETKNVEVIQIRSQAANVNGNTGDNEVAQDRNVVDAELMQGVKEFWSYNSRADLVVEDVRVNSHQTTIGVRDTDAGDVDYSVYFDNQHITSTASTSANAQLFLRLLDLDGMESAGQPLLNNPYNGFSFTLDGERVVLQSEAIIAAQTFAELVEAINEAIAANPALAGLTASLGSNYNAVNSDSGNTFQGTEIILTNAGSEALGAGGWLTPTGEAPADTNVLARQSNVPPTVTDPLTSVNVVLDNVGRGSASGDVEIGGMSQEGRSESKGIQQFDVKVERNSWIDELRSTRNDLEVVNVQNAEGFTGSLRIDELNDVRVFDAQAMKGAVTLTADLSAEVKDKYLKLEDTQANPDAEDQLFAYTTGEGNDSLNLTLSSANLGNYGLGYADMAVRVVTGAGDDTVDLSIRDGNGDLANNGNWYTHQQSLANITVDTGAGNDTVKLTGAGDVIVNTGAGNDTVYADNAGAQDVVASLNGDGSLNSEQSKAIFVLNADGLVADDLVGGGRVVYEGVIKTQAQVTFKGFESSWINVAYDSANGTTSTLQVNQAIKAAINNDPVLNKLLIAQDGPDGSLVIKSLIDGELVVGDLAIDVRGPLAVGSTANDGELVLVTGETVDLVALGNLELAFNDAHELATDAVGDDIVGADSTFASDNTINVGAGQDVIVLGTTEDASLATSSNDTVVFTGYNNGENTVVNFDVNGNGIDYIDFNAYLGAGAKTVVGAAGALADKAVAIVEFNNGVGASAGTFANLTADALLAALNGVVGTNADYLTAFSGFASANTTGLASDSDNYVLMVQNGANEGEYKVFHLTSADNSANFSSVQLVGTVDFGADLAFVAGNFAV